MQVCYKWPAVKYYPYSTFIILGLTKGSETEDKSYAESQETT